MMDTLPTLVGYAMFGLALLHALVNGHANRLQRLLMLFTLLAYGTLLETNGVQNGHYYYPRERFINLGVVPLSVSLAWVGIIYSAMALAERLQLPAGLRILATTLIALSLDWGMDPVATHTGAWIWKADGAYFGVPGFNMVGWFIIPISYLIAYGLAWDKPRRRLHLLTIHQVDAVHSWGRRIYTLLLVVPLAMTLLITSIRLLAKVPFLLNLPLPVIVVWAGLTVLGALAMIIWRREQLKKTHWADLLPPAVLAFIALSYTVFALQASRPDLALLMAGTGIPLWSAFGLSLRHA
jgi:uncharacterized membrane protein